MIFWILASCLALSAGPTPPSPSSSQFRVALTKRQNQLFQFDLDLGWARLYGVQASLDPEFLSVRMPASISKSGQSYPELDFSDPNKRVEVLQSLKSVVDEGDQKGDPKKILEEARKKIRRVPNEGRKPMLRVVSLESVKSKKGLKVAQGEIWFDGWLAVRFKLMRSKWSANPDNWWIAWPSLWDESTQGWQDLFVITDKELREKILDAVRDAYAQRESPSD